jgi:hypothetical protein
VARTNTRITADVLGIIARCHKAILPALTRFVKALHGPFDYNQCVLSLEARARGQTAKR